jgi:hypothetical protein
MTIEKDVYISADIEADGPIPGPYSMLAFGLCVAGRFDGRELEAVDPERQTFYTELKPISETFDPKALEVTGLDRERLLREGPRPQEAMRRAATWMQDVGGDDRVVVVGFPLVYDWLFLYWYLQRFLEGSSPISFSSGLDMKTMYQQKARVVLAAAGKDDLPDFLRSTRRHTHNALDDAIEQAEIFIKLFEWHGHDGAMEFD